MAAVHPPSLGEAALHCNLEEVENALAYTDPNELDMNGSTPLLKASSNNNKNCIAVVNALVNKGADVNKVDIGNKTPLMRAATNSHPDVVSTLLNLGADITATDKKGNTALGYAERRLDNYRDDVVRILTAAVGGGPAVGGGRRRKTRHRRISRRHRRFSRRSHRR